MKIMVGLLVAALLGVGTARPVRAQCNSYCAFFVSVDGTRNFTCYYAPDSNANCTSISHGCIIRMCETALLTDSAGQSVGLASLCGNNVNVRSLAHAAKPRTITKSRSQRAPAAASVARDKVPRAG